MISAHEFNACINQNIVALFPLDLSGSVVALRAGIDASSRESGVFCVAGVAYGYRRAVKANREWERLMDGRVFHMTDLNARRGDFAGISDTEVDVIMVGAIGIVRRYASYAVAVSCDGHLVSDALPVAASTIPDSQEMLRAFRSVYGYMCHLGMFALGYRANGWREISYIFERGDDGQRGLVKYLNFIQENNPGQDLFLDSYGLSRQTVTPKDRMEGIFHSSDLLAWEWAKHVERQKEDRPMRKSLSALVGEGHVANPDKYGLTLSDGKRFFFRHYTPERLERSIAFFRDALVATTADEVRAAFSRWEASR